MTILSRLVDQWIVIGGDIRVSPTDIDAQGVRLIARGRVMGGPRDGDSFDSAYELAIGQSCHLGPHVAVTLMEVLGETARIGVLAPQHIPVFAKEQVDQLRGGGQSNHGK